MTAIPSVCNTAQATDVRADAWQPHGQSQGTRRHFLGQAGALVLAGAGTALAPLGVRAASKINYGYTAVSDFASVFVGIEEGLFAKRGLEVEARFIPINSTLPAAIQSGSLELGGPTPTAFLQSVSGGLDHVVLGGGGAISRSYTELGLVARTGLTLQKPADCVGKKIGVPGLGALLHVTFRQWLKLGGVDARQVTFLEAAFPQHADMLRGGAVDAVVTGGPFMARILESGVGTVAAHYLSSLPEGQPTVVHVARRDWVQAHPSEAKAFREGLAEAAAFMQQPVNEAKVRAALGKYLKLPPPVAAKMQISPPLPVVTAQHLQWWADLMKEQGLLSSLPAPASLIAKA